jgi:hypothetical protein
MHQEPNPNGFDGCAFETPVALGVSGKSVVTIAQATNVVRERLQSQFTMVGLNTLLMLERAALGSEVTEARQAFAEWAQTERLT